MENRDLCAASGASRSPMRGRAVHVGSWLGFNWRYDSGLLAGAVPVADASLTVDLSGLTWQSAAPDWAFLRHARPDPEHTAGDSHGWLRVNSDQPTCAWQEKRRHKSATYSQNCGDFSQFWRECSRVSLQPRLCGGEGGIRTLGTGISQYNGLANRRIRPLCHLSGVRTFSLPRRRILPDRSPVRAAVATTGTA
jgi:hypothetical protein